MKPIWSAGTKCSPIRIKAGAEPEFRCLLRREDGSIEDFGGSGGALEAKACRAAQFFLASCPKGRRGDVTAPAMVRTVLCAKERPRVLSSGVPDSAADRQARDSAFSQSSSPPASWE